MMPASYAPHRDFIAPALRSPQLAKLIAGIIAVEFLFAILLTVLGLALERVSPGFANSFFTGSTPLGLMLQLLSFVLLAVCVNLVLVKQHERSFLSAIGPPQDAFRNMLAAFLGVALLFLAIEIFPPWYSLADVQEQRNIILWFLMVPFGLFALLIQTGAEELFYRGYIQQQLAARFSSPLVWMIVPNLIFAAAHWDNGATEIESLRYVIWAFCFGLAASDLTARTGNLGAAIGFHLANNAYAFLLFSEVGGPDSGLALFLFPPEIPLPGHPADEGPIFSLSLMVELAVIATSWLATRIAVRR